MDEVSFRGLRVALPRGRSTSVRAGSYVDDTRAFNHELATCLGHEADSVTPSFAPELIVGEHCDAEYARLKTEQLRLAAELQRVRRRATTLQSCAAKPKPL